MKNIIPVTDLNAPELFPFKCTSEVRLLRINEPELGVFVAESPNVIRRALDAGFEPLSLLCDE